MVRCAGCSAAGACTCALQVLDSPTVNLTLVGSGTSLDPWVLSGESPGSGAQYLATYAISGPLTAPTVGTLRFRFPFSATILGVSAEVNTAPTGSSIILDINKNGVSIFPIATKPMIAAGAFDTGAGAFEAVPNTTAIVPGDYLQVDIDQVGSIIAGSDLTVFIRYSRP